MSLLSKEKGPKNSVKFPWQFLLALSGSVLLFVLILAFAAFATRDAGTVVSPSLQEPSSSPEMASNPPGRNSDAGGDAGTNDAGPPSDAGVSMVSNAEAKAALALAHAAIAHCLSQAAAHDPGMPGSLQLQFQLNAGVLSVASFDRTLSFRLNTCLEQNLHDVTTALPLSVRCSIDARVDMLGDHLLSIRPTSIKPR